MGSFSIWHWLIVLLVVVLIFGTKKLRNIGADLGGAVRGFKDGMREGGDKAAEDKLKASRQDVRRDRTQVRRESRQLGEERAEVARTESSLGDLHRLSGDLLAAWADGFQRVGWIPLVILAFLTILTFVVDGLEVHDIAMTLDELANVAVRSGMHCTHAWYRSHGLSGSVRASFYLYNTHDEVDALVTALHKVRRLFS